MASLPRLARLLLRCKRGFRTDTTARSPHGEGTAAPAPATEVSGGCGGLSSTAAEPPPFTGRWLRDFVVDVVKFACAVHVISEYIGEVTLCVGPSMQPTLNSSGDIILTECISHRRGKIERGDVVVAISPRDPGTAVCKRVCGLPGDRVCSNPSSEYSKVRPIGADPKRSSREPSVGILPSILTELTTHTLI